jgi:malonate transporter
VTAAVFYKLAAIFLMVGIGYVAGRMRWLGDERRGADPARTLANAAFYIFVPALLFRTTARLDVAAMPWGILAAFFVPVLAMLLALYAWQRRARARDGLDAAAPSTRAITASFGNSVQLGIPLAAALFGETGLGLHVTVVSLHALVLLSVLTALVELDLARERAGGQSLAVTLRATLRNTIVHPVVLPVLAGLVWHATGVGLPPVVDEVLELLGSAVVPLCVVLIGMSLAYYGVRGGVRGAVVSSVFKLLVLPALVLACAWGLFGLRGLPLEVIVMMAALPTGSNSLIFAQRYTALEAETTAAIVISTLAFVATAPLWLALLAALRQVS